MNIFGFVGHTVFVAAALFCPCSVKAARMVSKQMGVGVFRQNFIYKNRRGARFGLWAVVWEPTALME